MPSKYCPHCDKTVTSSSNPVYCCWCGRFLEGDLLPADYTEAQKVIARLKIDKNLPKMDTLGQVKLF